MIQAPRGTRDVLPQDVSMWQWIEQEMRKQAALSGYREIRTPVFEHTELFQRGVGDTTDIVQKEMYTFLDKGKRSITLKPEGTAGTVRAMIENKLYADPLPVKVYYLNSPTFRYENPQSGRLREHHQFGMECFGASDPSVDAELITTLLHILENLGMKNLCVHINSIGCPVCRPVYHEQLMNYLNEQHQDLCPTCNDRMKKNPLRVLDCKEEKCKVVTAQAPVIMDSLCPECEQHFTMLKELLKQNNVTFSVDTHIVRGLDYYTKTVFEVIMQSEREGLALCGGGRYDGLSEDIGGPKLCGVGFAIGTERIIMELNSRGIKAPTVSVCDVYVANISADDKIAAFNLTNSLRLSGLKTDCDHVGRSLKAQFKYANKLGVPVIIMVGGDEASRGNVRIKNLNTGEEKEVGINNAYHEANTILENNQKENQENG